MRTALVCVLCTLTLVSGCKKRNGDGSPGQAGASAPATPGDPAINQWLWDVIRAHRLAAHIDGQWVAFEGPAARVNGEVVSDKEPNPSTDIVQLAMRLKLPDGRVVVQPVVGFGKDREGAIAHAEASFLLGTFHAWLGAFVDPGEEHVERAERVIGGKKRLITFGDLVTKTAGDAAPKDGNKWRDLLLRELDRSDLSSGVHWVDVYHGQIQEHQELEIQLDNARWPEMEAKMRDAPWPNVGRFTSVRLFLVIQDPDDPTRPKVRPATLPTTQPAETSRAIPGH